MPLARITAALTAIVVVLVPLSCAQLALRLVSGETVVYDGVLKLPAESLFGSVVTALAWTFAITWALTILSGRYDRPAREALRSVG